MDAYVKKWLSDPSVEKLVAACISILIISVLVHFSKRYVSAHIIAPDSRYRTRKFITFIGYSTGIVAVAAIYSDRLGGLTVVFGVAGAGIAFSLQEVIASIAGWLAVLIGNFYKTGDRIQLGGIIGDVIDIGILRTTLMECRQWVGADQYNGRIVRVGNSSVFKDPVFNYSADFHFLWDEVIVPVKYGSDYRLARDILQRVANEITGEFTRQAKEAWKVMVRKYMIEDEKIEPMVTLVLTDNWIEFAVRYVVDYKRRRTTKDQLFTRILEEVEKTGGRVGIASTTIQIVDLPALDVKIKVLPE